MDDAPARFCHACGAEGKLLYENLQDQVFDVRGQWNLRKCNNVECNSLWMDPMPLETELHKAYESYFTHDSAPTASQESELKRRVRRLVRWLERVWLALLFLKSERKSLECMYLDRLTPGRLLEVGCGDGHRMVEIQKLGWKVEGQEIDPLAAAAICKTLAADVHLGDLTGLALPGESYDAIVMNHVIEHVYDPTVFIEECHRLLKPNGVLISISPNPNSFGHVLFGAAWRGLELPRHLHLFTASALEKIANTSGFVKRESWTTSARAGLICAASLDIKWSGRHKMGGSVSARNVISAFLCSLAARVAHVFKKDSGEEVVLCAVK